VDDKEIDDELWADACYLAEDSEYLMDRDVVEIMLREAKTDE